MNWPTFYLITRHDGKTLSGHHTYNQAAIMRSRYHDCNDHIIMEVSVLQWLFDPRRSQQSGSGVIPP